MDVQAPNTQPQLLLHAHAEEAYLQYAIATVKDRALAQVQDGQKPVQKRILFAMRELGLLTAVKPVKSARVVGDVIGKYHPHGDTAAYDALVRMAQDFSLRYPLITGQGNFGSRDGDSAAAYRYTECRLSPYADLLLSELDMGTVDWQANFDGSMNEPVLLPARLPFLLLNGCIGIAVGMASDIPPHNLKEVALAAIAVLENPEVSLNRLLELIPGPDFPDGGHLISSPEDIAEAYATGRGILRCRARWRREDLARSQWQIVVHELPYQVSAKKIMEQIAAITDPAPPSGKKSITAQQAVLRTAALELLDNVVDESSKDEKVRIVIHPKNSKVSPDTLMAFLLGNTSLEDSVSLNMNAIGIDGSPRTKNLKDILTEWGEFRTTTVRRRTAHELSVAEKRIHILEGRMIVFLHMDDIIHLIRTADDPKHALMIQFGLSEVQSQDILEMRLRQINKLEGIKLEKELTELQKLADRLRTLLSNEKALRKLIIKEIAADAEKFGDERRTLIQPEQRMASNSLPKKTSDEPLTVILTKNFWIRARPGHEVDLATVSLKPGDAFLAVTPTRGNDLLIALDSLGRAYSIDPLALPTAVRGDGIPLTTLIDIQNGATIVALLAGRPDDAYLFAGSKGYGFKTKLASLVARPKAGKAFLTLAEAEAPLAPVRLSAESGFVLCGSSDGRLLAFDLTEVKSLDKGKGVQLMSLPEDTKLCGLAWLAEAPITLELQGSAGPIAYKLKKDDWSRFCGHRARKGAALPKKTTFASAGKATG